VRWLDHKLFFPGSESLWLPFAKLTLARMMRTGPKPDIAVVSSGPPAVLKLVLFLKERYGVPYIIEWRDEWTNNPELVNSALLAQPSKRELDLENRVLSASSGCVYLTALMRDSFVRNYNFLQNTHHEIIPNGYDEEDFHSLPHKIPHGPEHQKMRIYYSGSLYDRRQPDPLWKALLDLVRDTRIPAEAISFEIRGNNRKHFVLGKFHLDPLLDQMVKLLPYLPYKQNLKAMMSYDVLLLYIPGGINTDSVLTGKIFEYLRASKPVLAVIPAQGIAAQILRDAGIGFIASDTDAAGIKDQLLKLYQAWKDGSLGSIKTNPDILPRYSRSAQAQQFAGLIERVLD